MSFDDDAAGEGAGFRPPPHPDDRLWRHPSELVEARQVRSRPTPRQPWPWGVVAAVGTVGVVLVTLGGALYLGLRSQVDGVETREQAASTTTVVSLPPDAAERAWLGIEGYDELASVEPDIEPGSTGDRGEVAPAPTEGTEPPVEGPDLDGGSAGEHGTSEPETTTTGSTLPAGVVVTEVDPEGPAAEALHPGDVVLAVGGQPVSDMEMLLAALQSYRPGDEVQITYKTTAADGAPSTTTVQVTLAERPAEIRPVRAGRS